MSNSSIVKILLKSGILKLTTNLQGYYLYRKFHKYTMIPSKTFTQNINVCKRFRNISGCIVECGVWRGGMIAAFAKLLGNQNRTYYLFDSFEGLPQVKEIDGVAARTWQENIESPFYYDNCKAEPEFADEAMKLAGCKNYQLIKGWFSDTIPGYKFKDNIALLRLDGDWYDSTMVCLTHLYPKIVKGGLIIIDDYYTWEGCSKAVHDYLSINKIPSKIHQFKNICYIIKE